MSSFSLGSSWGWQRVPTASRRALRGQRCKKPAASSGEPAIGRASYVEKIRAHGAQAPIKAAITSGSLSALGDVLAQLLAAHWGRAKDSRPPPYDPMRTLRMFGFGACWYGPYQFLWYNLLDHLMPLRTTTNFVLKVALNQLALAPVVLAVVFAWNLGWTGQGADAILAKIQRDLVPSMINGWKFWIPAASLNFYAIPLPNQVLYMSCCSVLWTGYLSYASQLVAPVAG